MKIKKSELIFFSCYGILIFWRILKDSLYGQYLFNDTIDKVLGVVLILGFCMQFFAKKMSKKYLFMLPIIMILALLCVTKSNVSMFLLIVIAIFSSHNIDFKNIVKFSMMECSVLLAFVVVSALVGIIPNLAIQSQGAMGQQYCLGFSYFTVVPSMVLYIIIMRMYTKENISNLELLFYQIVVAVVYLLTEVILNLILCEGLLLLYILVFKLKLISFDTKAKRNLYMMIAISIPTLIIAMCLAYNLNIPIIKTINLLTNNRIVYSNYGLRKYGLSLFGNEIAFNADTTKGLYFFLDIGYIYYLLVFGLVGFVVFVGGMLYIYYQSMKRQELMIWVWCVVVIVESMIGRTFDSIWRNPLLFCAITYLYSDIATRKKIVVKRE